MGRAWRRGKRWGQAEAVSREEMYVHCETLWDTRPGMQCNQGIACRLGARAYEACKHGG